MEEINSATALNPLRVNEIVDAALSGDENASAQIKQHFKAAIFFMLLRMVSNRADAEALSIKVFEVVFANLHKYESQVPFCVWLFRIASNMAIEHLRRRKQ